MENNLEPVYMSEEEIKEAEATLTEEASVELSEGGE